MRQHTTFCSTQVGRALHELGIDHIPAYSPQVRGRSERLFRTLQDRLPKELRLAGVRTMATANRWLREVYLTQHNARFAVPAGQPGTAFVADPRGLWRDALSVHEDRLIGNDNTVIWRRLRLQLPPSPLRPHFVRATVRVREYWDGRLSASLGPHRLADFTADGTLIDDSHNIGRVTPLDATEQQGLAPARKQNRADTSLAT